MSHRYDHFYRLLADQIVVQARTIREAERLGLRRTLLELKSIGRDTREIASNVLTKIEGAHVAAMLEGGDPQTKMRRDFIAETAALPGRDIVPLVNLFPRPYSTAVFTKEFFDVTAANPEGPPGPETAGAVEACTETTNPTEGE